MPQRGVEVTPLGLAEVVEPVRGTGRLRVTPVGGDEHRELVAAQGVEHVEDVFAGGAEAVHGDHPGVPGAGHEPRGQRPEFARHVEDGVVDAERGGRVADVDVRGEAGPVAGFRRPVGDAFEAAYDGVGGMGRTGQHGAHDRVEPLADEAVAAGAQGGEVTGEGHLAGGGGVDGEPRLGGQGPTRGDPQGGVAGEPGKRPPRRRRPYHGGDGCGRRSGCAHVLQCHVGTGTRPVGGARAGRARAFPCARCRCRGGGVPLSRGRGFRPRRPFPPRPRGCAPDPLAPQTPDGPVGPGGLGGAEVVGGPEVVDGLIARSPSAARPPP